MEFKINSKNETARGFSIVAQAVVPAVKGGEESVDSSKIIQLTGQSEDEAKNFPIGAKIKVS